MNNLNITGLFSAEAIRARFESFPKVVGPIMDLVYLTQDTHPLAVIGKDEIYDTLDAVPLVFRGGASVALSSAHTGDFYEPHSIRINYGVNGAELNNLRLLDPAALDNWANGKTLRMRQLIRLQVNAMCGLALSGTLTWPRALPAGGFEDMTFVYGTIKSVTPDKMWDAADIKIGDVVGVFDAMLDQLQAGGYGGDVVVLAGATAWKLLRSIALAVTTTAVKGNAGGASSALIELPDEETMIVGGYTVKRRGQTYKNPSTGAAADIIPAKKVMMVAKDAGHRLTYCAVDDLDANLQALPFFIKPIKTEDPSGWKLVAESKPFPMVNARGVCGAQVQA